MRARGLDRAASASALSQIDAAVDVQGLAGDVAGVGAGEIAHGGGELLRRAAWPFRPR